MSYDLQVFAQQALTTDDLQGLLGAAGLAEARPDSAETGMLSVTRGARARYSFTLGLPVPVEAEDVPEEVTAVLLEPSFLYEMMVEGSSTTETPHAVRFARRLAQASAGVVLDQQTGQIWARGKPRSVPAVQRGVIDIVEFRWYVRSGGTGGPAAQSWLDAARRYLPEALPRRFGSYEPLSMKLDVDGPDAFVQTATEESLLFFKTSPPSIDGSLAGGIRGRGVTRHSMSMHRGALSDLRWRMAAQRLFLDFATATNAFFASAEVQRDVGWSGRSISFGWNDEPVVSPARGGWAGLPPYPVWWSWFGPDYIPLVRDHLPEDQILHVHNSVFHARSDPPLDRDQLTAAFTGLSAAPQSPATPDGPPLRPYSPPLAATWLPADLLLAFDHNDQSGQVLPPPLIPATTIPSGLLAEGPYPGRFNPPRWTT